MSTKLTTIVRRDTGLVISDKGVGPDFKTIEIPDLPDGSTDWEAIHAARCPCPGYIPPDPSTIAPKKPPKQKSVRCTHCRGGWISGGSP